ncbi:MAG TPA: FtsX-like permease family protein [Candidatus Paceibacterota bacterium]|nr:FtsX-like permease family protein [Candidatus Paceibacterota bacterium]
MIDLKTLKVAWFLGYRQIKRASVWTNVLIIIIMVLTFLNLVVVSGLLVGLIEGAVAANKKYYTGDIIISKLKENNSIQNSREIISTIENTPGIKSFSPRYLVSGLVEANYRNRTNFDDVAEEVGVIITGINPDREDQVTGIASLVIEGEFLEPDDFDKVIVGALMLEKYLDINSPGFLVLRNVEIGSKIRLKIGNSVREVTVKGITKGKVDETDRRIFMNDVQLRSMMDRNDLNVGEIAILVDSKHNPETVRDILINNGLDKFAQIQTFEDAQPKFLLDIKRTFTLLGTIISSIGLAVAAITVFIVIFINAITRRKYIGIMKAIGVNGKVIELAYVFQSLIYAIVGSIVGLFLVYFLLIPYFDNNPINFPFSDGILVAPALITTIRVFILIIVTALAGYIPARIIVSKNTLDSILGRK